IDLTAPASTPFAVFAHARHRDQRVAGAPRNASIHGRRADFLAPPESAHTFRHGNAARFVGHMEATRTSSPSTAWAQSFFPHHPPERTTVATCGTTVVVRDAAVTLWA
ncbi:TPA: hypothetical protein ACKFJT_001965, partial [Burkholderia cenocepacia]